jgi:hypothetical protein
MPTFKHLTVKHDAKIKDDLKVSDNLKVKGNLSLAGDQLVGGNLTVSGTTNALSLYSRSPVTALVAATTSQIAATQSGTIFTINNANTAGTYYLPAPAIGLKYTFLWIAASSATIIFNVASNGGTSIIGRGFLSDSDAAVSYTVVCVAFNGVTAVTATSSAVNSYVTMTCVSSTQWVAETYNLATATTITVA